MVLPRGLQLRDRPHLGQLLTRPRPPHQPKIHRADAGLRARGRELRLAAAPVRSQTERWVQPGAVLVSVRIRRLISSDLAKSRLSRRLVAGALRVDEAALAGRALQRRGGDLGRLLSIQHAAMHSKARGTGRGWGTTTVGARAGERSSRVLSLPARQNWLDSRRVALIQALGRRGRKGANHGVWGLSGRDTPASVAGTGSSVDVGPGGFTRALVGKRRADCLPEQPVTVTYAARVLRGDPGRPLPDRRQTRSAAAHDHANGELEVRVDRQLSTLESSAVSLRWNGETLSGSISNTWDADPAQNCIDGSLSAIAGQTFSANQTDPGGPIGFSIFSPSSTTQNATGPAVRLPP